MTPVELLELPDTRSAVFGANQPEYIPLPALIFPDGKILTEWQPSEAERTAIARGENIRLWIWKPQQHTCARCGQQDPVPLQPVALSVTDEQHG